MVTYTVVHNSAVVLRTEKLPDACAKLNLLMNQLVNPDSAEILADGVVVARVKPGSLSYDNLLLQPDVSHWFKLSPTESQKTAYFRCQEAIKIYSDRCMKLLPKKSIVSNDLKSWLERTRQVLENELPMGNPYSTKAAATLSVYHLYSKPPEQRDLHKILSQLRLAFLYCHIAIFSDAGPDIVHYLKPAHQPGV